MSYTLDNDIICTMAALYAVIDYKSVVWDVEISEELEEIVHYTKLSMCRTFENPNQLVTIDSEVASLTTTLKKLTTISDKEILSDIEALLEECSHYEAVVDLQIYLKEHGSRIDLKYITSRL